MRGHVTASASVAIVTAVLGACAPSRPPPPPREPPARVMTVGLDWISLRASAYVELHAWLAAAARGASSPPRGADAAVAVYRRALDDDEADELLARTTQALARCSDDACVETALDGTPLLRAFPRSLPRFAAEAWTTRAATSRAAIEIARAALSEDTEALARRLERDLAIASPHGPVRVDVVVEAPPPGREAIVPLVLAARSTCFAKAEGGLRVQNTRIIDCVLVQAMRALRGESTIAQALERALGPREGARAWDVLAAHAVAATLTAWEPKHVSPMRRSAMAIEPGVLGWLAERWRVRASGEQDAASFATAYAEAWRSRTKNDATP